MGILDSLVGRLTRGQSSGPYALTDDDRQALKRNGLLQAGLAMLASPSNGGQGIARGLLAGVQGVQDGAGQLVNDRYRTDVMQRTQDQMAANTAREQAVRGVLNPDFTINQDGLGRLAQTDPLEAIRLRAQVEALTAPKPFEPNPTRTRIAGRQEIQEEFDRTTGQWKQIGIGDRWGNSVGGGGGGGGGGGLGLGRPPSGFRWTADGSLEPIPGGPQDPNRQGAPQVAGTEGERKASFWVEQALMARDSITSALRDDPEALNPSYASRGAELLPFGLGDNVANALRSGPQQRALMGAKQLAEVALRAATGAGQNESEARQKIEELTPQIGDKPETVAQKLAAMDVYIKGFTTLAGRALTDDQRTRVDQALNSPAGGKPPAAPAGARRVSTQAEYDALPSGATFIDAEDGKTYRKP